MKIVSRFLALFGYVRLSEYGYALSPNGRIVEVEKVEDDRFEPPPFQPIAWQNPVSLLPPIPARPPVPRPLPPAPADEVEAEPVPLFRVPAVSATVETAPPGESIDIPVEEEVDEEEWEWKMAVARAKSEKAAAARGKSASSLPLSPPPVGGSGLVPMSKIARPAVARPAPAKPVQRIEPRKVTQPLAGAPAKPAARTTPPKAPPPRKPPSEPAVARDSARSSLEKSVSRVLPPPPVGKPRPLPRLVGNGRLARGTHGPIASGGEPVRTQLARGSSRHAAATDQDVTATDVTAVDRAQASMQADEDTRLNLVVAPASSDITLDLEEQTTVDPKPHLVSDGSPLPRLSARLRRPSIPN
jgi:hypothetical protein